MIWVVIILGVMVALLGILFIVCEVIDHGDDDYF